MEHIVRISKESILEALQQVFDPEIPVISVVDLGIISNIEIDDSEHVTIYMTPTFSSCPALKLIASDIQTKAKEITGHQDIEVIIDKQSGWDTNRITEKGLGILKKFGLAPPKRYTGDLEVDSIADATCPHCNSDKTSLSSVFGSTLCRSMHYCYDCDQTFEQFKPL
jgi:ring-1,2-phenylacetyl-CoA epoxidase subunit PaaD